MPLLESFLQSLLRQNLTAGDLGGDWVERIAVLRCPLLCDGLSSRKSALFLEQVDNDDGTLAIFYS